MVQRKNGEVLSGIEGSRSLGSESCTAQKKEGGEEELPPHDITAAIPDPQVVEYECECEWGG
ncbi:hypothetical protein EYF80_015149 [Liparis tanakae]|uniref:Uncharacterized protein n=1 Tax=Liparis tanakae TaxID=230148 RepID=A0A4Z2IB25_9TELE|nr:hypothetical protein EYF80_015149 [Liparis tanakae]